MNIWLANVCSISGKSDSSQQRKDHIVDLISKHWPEVVIMVETNHQTEPNILSEFYDNFCTPFSEDKGIIILSKKLLACEKISNLENRGLVVRSKIIKNLTFIGIYCPYYNLRESTVDFILKYQVGEWFIGGDMENFGDQIINFLDHKYWADIDFSRELNGVKSKTEYIGYFYEKPKISTLDKISDHVILNAEICTKWDGIEISFPKQLSRISAICSIKNENSKSFSEILVNWPEKDFKTCISGLIPYKKRTVKIFKKEISLDDISDHVKKSYKREKNKKILNALKNALVSKDLKTVANISAACLRIQRKGKQMLTVLGLTDTNGKIYVGNNAIRLIKEFYGELYNKNGCNEIIEKVPESKIEFNDNIFDKVLKNLSTKKAMGWDQLPDEILKFPRINRILKDYFKEILSNGKVAAYLKFGRICLLSKEKGNSFPQIENTRPIVILSSLYKLIELYWIELAGEILWNHIGLHQMGFRKKCGTQFNIIYLKKWLRSHKKSALIFIDIKKAYDSVIREKLYDLLAFIRVPTDLINLYIELTTNMRIYVSDDEYISYTIGLPQGSCISPVLFNIYYEEALRKINPFTDILLGYADDGVCGNLYENLKNIHKIDEEFNNWDLNLNLKIHPIKTNVLLYYCEKPEKLQYPVVDDFTYLGVKIYNKTSQFTKTFIMKQIRKLACKTGNFYIKMSTLKLSKFAITWWFLSKLFYDQISNLYLEFISISDFVQVTNAQIKKILGVKRGIPQDFVMNLLNINLEITAKKMIEKIRKNCPLEIGENKIGEHINDILLEEKFVAENSYWNYVLTTLDVNINSFYYICSKNWWTKNGKYQCKFCNVNLSLFHLKDFHNGKFPFLNSDEFSWIIEITETFNFKRGLIYRNIEKNVAAKWIKCTVEKLEIIKNEAIQTMSIKVEEMNEKNEEKIKEKKLQNKKKLKSKKESKKICKKRNEENEAQYEKEKSLKKDEDDKIFKN